jgi:hypothetical protein
MPLITEKSSKEKQALNPLFEKRLIDKMAG